MKTERLSKRYELELEIITAAYRCAGMPREDLVYELECDSGKEILPRAFVLDTYRENQKIMRKLKLQWQ